MIDQSRESVSARSWPSLGRNDEELALLDRNYRAATLVKALARKARRRLFGFSRQIEPAYRFGYVIFDQPQLQGGGPGFGQDYIRILDQIGLNDCGRLFEFCSGPGYIGYALLSRGFCDSLALADVNPLAVEAAKRTAEFNGIGNRVSIYLSDGLDQIPATERWDLVVGNPPHFLDSADKKLTLLLDDPGWRLHRNFYSDVRRFLKPGGQVLLQENALGSCADVFAPMIRNGGGRLLDVFPGPDIGAGGNIYYILSSWD